MRHLVHGSRGYDLDLVAKERAPARGASFPTLHDEMNSSCTTQMRRPCLYVGQAEEAGKYPHPSGVILLPILVTTNTDISDD